ncbi:hypothetical protein [Mucisphaera calidilacus]|uniref:Chromosome partition protein Smc n=1 Tax=Mucisphaera calidilacus TaxID=2527982 RepID=A0A518BZB9_9BACT|nr:hypothetical protein [Mucisphaera calidilacus]QDU72323.1 Chromosome partition protein Smc [Mucisphaera calidilacus]
MSFLTKVLVVLVSVLSILLVALTVPFVATIEDAQTELAQTKNSLEVAEAKARSAQTEINAAMSAGAEKSAAMQATIEQLTGELAKTQSESAESRAALVDANSKLVQREADTSSLSATARQNAELITELTNRIAATETRRVDAETKRVELQDQVSELASLRDSLERTVRRLKESQAQLERANAQLVASIAKLPEDQRAIVMGETTQEDAFEIEPDRLIRGEVTGIDQIDQLMLVQVNVGEVDGVEKNMIFRIHRQGQFLGQLRITTVDTDNAAGSISLAQGAIQVGDSALAGLAE